MDEHVEPSEAMFPDFEAGFERSQCLCSSKRDMVAGDPEPEEVWAYRQPIQIMKELMNGRRVPTTLEGLERALRALAK